MEDGLTPGYRTFVTDYNHRVALVVHTGVTTVQITITEDQCIALASDLVRLAKKLNK